ncbi:EAL domain-containing protein [Larsenimonas suaedae]|uniref:EAL domain-containing protein n=1 Tax=Larsenimonas suaedae TaxID=1851019 RepID=A0ABU1GRT0_9GAMM|nr:EAL domain-containing protein [Larsenimonas suaedae]MCM2972473.1 EAL domain-containing protein [Larsenimonas suaedae]MDR5894731.1 EAL domain-containing protein [Larsenimonas suaedae]
MGLESPERRFEQLKAQLAMVFQPIIDVETGRCCAVEALMRGVGEVGFDSPLAVLAWAERVGKLAEVDALVRARTLVAFKALEAPADVRLFLNLENRLFATPTLTLEALLAELEHAGVAPESLVLEISERHSLAGETALEAELARWRAAGIGLALDDFGIELSNLDRLYTLGPEVIKLDKQFICGLGSDPRQVLFVKGVVALARSLGIKVVAEGVEDAAALEACREVGCQYVQGYFIEAPTAVPCLLRCPFEVASAHDLTASAGASHERQVLPEQQFLLEQLSQPPVLTLDMAMSDALTLFRQNAAHSHFPVLDAHGVPLGVVTERMLRRYVYSPYGYALLQKRTVNDQLAHLLKPCASVTLGTSAAGMIERYYQPGALRSEHEGVCALEQGRYAGFWTPEAILSALQWRDMKQARDENPLTRLPGNHTIERTLRDYLTHTRTDWATVYFDLDYFKPFNDHYGFRRGDEVLLLFARLLESHFSDDSAFLGHVGGDDFVMFLPCPEVEKVCIEVTALLATFSEEVRALYSAPDLADGGFMGTDRSNQSCWFPLLTTSAAMLVVPGRGVSISEQRLLETSVLLKGAAKVADSNLCCASVYPEPQATATRV